jgi:hypothetical protein
MIEYNSTTMVYGFEPLGIKCFGLYPRIHYYGYYIIVFRIVKY